MTTRAGDELLGIVAFVALVIKFSTYLTLQNSEDVKMKRKVILILV